ncbi:MAG: hypothetical protein DRJ60_05415 [Thermoprotei archaeon]|nr:MAG: hypothetical protein DRJ60_05415 [Thermoprotei archaeon]
MIRYRISLDGGSSELGKFYFKWQAYWGCTKHGGGLKATKELVELCRINKGKYVLDVGCGVGATACYIAEKYGSRVIGVDILKEMIEWANKRAKRKGVEDRIEFMTADAQNLPFRDALFDAVIGETIISFIEDKCKVIEECVRVVKEEGYVGFNEPTWIREPPLNIVEYYFHAVGARPETPEGWIELLKTSGLRDITMRVHRLSILSKLDEVRMYSLRDLLRATYRFLSLYAKNPDFRKYVKEVPRPPRNILKYLGYGIYVGRR